MHSERLSTTNTQINFISAWPPLPARCYINDVIEAHGYGMRFRLMIVSIHVAKVQIRKTL